MKIGDVTMTCGKCGHAKAKHWFWAGQCCDAGTKKKKYDCPCKKFRKPKVKK